MQHLDYNSQRFKLGSPKELLENKKCTFYVNWTIRPTIPLRDWGLRVIGMRQFVPRQRSMSEDPDEAPIRIVLAIVHCPVDNGISGYVIALVL